MEFNLRKARKLESKIGAFVAQKQREVKTFTSVRVNEDLSKLDDIINKARGEFFDEFNNINNLVEARQEIRDLIAKANVNTGISDLMAQKVLAEAKLSKLNHFLGFNIYDKQSVEDELEYAKKALENGERFAETNARVNFMTDVDQEKFKKDKQETIKKVEDLEDKLAELNYSSKVKLSANTVKLLKDNFLL